MSVDDEATTPPVNPEREALRVLAERGWCQGRLEAADGRVCIIGAGLTTEDLVDQVISEQFPSRLGVPGKGLLHLVPIAAFNDHPDTTLEDVVMVLEKAAIRRDEMVTP